MPIAKPNPQVHALPFRILRMAAGVMLGIYGVFLAVSVASGSLGGALLFAPAVFFGLVLVLLLIFWPVARPYRLRMGLAVSSAVIFAISGFVSFHVMFKFIQPTVLPKRVVPVGAPWAIEGNVFTNNDYNNPVVVQLTDGTYRMYFHDHDDMETAVSTDGKQFTDVTKLFQGQMPTVVKLPDGRWRMYYFVNANVPPTGQPAPIPQPMPMQHCGDNCRASKHDLVSAVSSDGLHWTQEPGIRLAPSSSGYDRDTMIHPSVIQLGDGSYKLYYDGEVDPTSSVALASHYRKILSASSVDGLTWTRDPGYRIDEKPLHTWEAYSPKALYEHGKVVLHFTTPNGIYEATSTDTLHFTISKSPVFSPGRIPMPSDNGALGSYQDAYVLPVSGGNRIYFWIDGKGIYSAFQKT